MPAFRRWLISFLIISSFFLPAAASAANVFGGKVGAFVPCVNAATWNTVGAPRGGIYIYQFGATRTYPFGAPGPGRWTLGLYGIPYFCIVSIFPLIVFPGIAMTMEASSH